MSRGKHREFPEVSTQQSLRSFATYAERHSHTIPFLPSLPFSLSLSFSTLTFLSLRNLSLRFGSPICLLLVSCAFSVFSASSAAECHNFRESLRFGRRWVEARTTNPHQTNRLQKTCREPRRNPRAAVSSSRLSFRRRAFSTAMFLSPFFLSSRSRAFYLSLLHARPSFFTNFSHFITARCRPVSRCNVKDCRE